MNKILKLTYEMLLPILSDHQIVGDSQAISITEISSLNEAKQDSLVFIAKERGDKQALLNITKAKVVLINSVEELSKEVLENKIFIIVNDPKIIFSKVGNNFFVEKPICAIHPTAVIHKDAIIAKNVFIGANCIIGKGTIGEGTILYGNVFIYDNFKIGKNVKINAGTVIGAEGFGYNRDEAGIPIQFPHVGGVVIEDDVEIGSNTSIDKGALTNTIIKRGAKIDNLVHIAHNVIIGEYAYVIANAMIGGSTIIGNKTYVAPSVSIKDQLSIGENSLIGMSASVLKNIPDNQVWTGSPAQPI
jgi:UDP-3-O-[3-hydroxymyristoyl] glucosamine N-acyltransferase